MKRVLLGLCLWSATASADTDRTKRILTDAVLKGVVKGTETRYGATCVLPKESEIDWRCLNGPQCGYALSVRCTTRAGKVWQLDVQGFDDGTSNDVLEVKLSLMPTREKPLHEPAEAGQGGHGF